MPIVLGSKFGHVPTYPVPKIITGPRASRYAAGDRRDLVPEHQASAAEHAADLQAQRNADMVNRHMAMGQFDLSMAEQKRVQKLRNGLAAIEEARTNRTLTDEEANMLKLHVQTGLKPYEWRLAQSQINHMNMQTEMLRHQAEAQAMANLRAKELQSQNGNASFYTDPESGERFTINHKSEMTQVKKPAGKEMTWNKAMTEADKRALREMPSHYDPTYKSTLDAATGKPKAGEAMDKIQNDLKRQHRELRNKYAGELMGEPEESKETQAGPFGGPMSAFLEQYPQAMGSAVQGAQQPPGQMPQAGAPAQPPQNAPPSATPDFNQARTQAAQAMTGTQMVQAATGGQSPLQAINTVESFMRDYKNLSQLSPEQQQQYQEAAKIAAPFFAAPGG